VRGFWIWLPDMSGFWPEFRSPSLTHGFSGYSPGAEPRQPCPSRTNQSTVMKMSVQAQAGVVLAICLLAVGPHAVADPLDEPIKPIPLTFATDPAKAALGQSLFMDKRFSRTNSIACVSCHGFDQGGASPLAKPIGASGKAHFLNSPSVFNSAFNFRQLWSGGLDSVESVVDQVVKSPLVFDSSWDEIIRKLAADRELSGRFKQVYRDGLTQVNLSNALAEYTRSLTTPNARFDNFLRGDANAINAEEKKGYTLFKQYGCVACHQGVNAGGNMYQKFGVMGDYFKNRGNVVEADYGRFNFTRRESDRFVFRVPSLRNVILTAPYFHDGSAATIGDAVDVMFMYQLGRAAPQQDKELIIKFLATLTGDQPKAGR
jgi:cytochrome c peroxidase